MATYERLDSGSPDGSQWGDSGALIGFYGAVPVVQRPYTAAVHASSAYASSTAFDQAQLDVFHEIQKTLVALGVWATA